MATEAIEGVSPCLLVRDVPASIAFYCDRLGFEVRFVQTPDDPFFTIVGRDGGQLFLKSVGVTPTPNRSRHPWAGWDAFFHVPDPTALAADFEDRGAEFHTPLGINSDNLLGFEIVDPDGYVLYFGRPD